MSNGLDARMNLTTAYGRVAAEELGYIKGKEPVGRSFALLIPGIAAFNSIRRAYRFSRAIDACNIIAQASPQNEQNTNNKTLLEALYKEEKYNAFFKVLIALGASALIAGAIVIALYAKGIIHINNPVGPQEVYVELGVPFGAGGGEFLVFGGIGYLYRWYQGAKGEGYRDIREAYNAVKQYEVKS